MLLADLKKKLEGEMSGHDTAHYAGRALAAIGPIEEWLKELAKHGYDYVVIPKTWWEDATAKQDPSVDDLPVASSKKNSKEPVSSDKKDPEDPSSFSLKQSPSQISAKKD